jgi:PAS domain S-box-containing protein
LITGVGLDVAAEPVSEHVSDASERARILGDASKAFAESVLRIDALLAEVSQRVTACLGDTCIIRTLEPDGRLLGCRAFFTRVEAAAQLMRAILAQPLSSTDGESAEAMRTGRALIMHTPDPAELARRYPSPEVASFLEQFAPRAIMIAPLRSRGRSFGTITVASLAPGATYTKDDLAFLEELASRGALAIENADLFQRLAKSEAKLHLAMEVGRIGMFEWDIVGGGVFWSPAIEEAHGIPKGSFEGTFDAFQRDIHPEDRARLLTAIETVVREGNEHHIEYRIVRPDGEVRWLEGHARLQCDADGRPARLLGICTDVTERKRTASELQRTLESLTDAHRRKDEFLAMLSHELRNPLTPMQLAVSMLTASSEVGDPNRRASTILDRQLRHMTRLVDELLDVSRISRGMIDLRQEPVELRRIVREAVFDHADPARARDIRLEVRVPDEACWVTGDPVRLTQVLGNLLGNSLKFSKPGQRISITLVREPADGWYSLSVLDEGAGIAPELLPSIFEPFTQAEIKLDRTRAGLGLGLAVVRGLVELHGGRVAAHSAGEGTGAELRVLLPPGAAPSKPTRRAATFSARPMRVLIVEDNPDIVELLSTVLRFDGHSVEVAMSGCEALATARRVKPQVVLCDLGLPDKDGFAVAAELRAAPDTANVHLIAISGYGSNEHKRRSREAGFEVHLTKPLDTAELLALIAGMGADERAPL